jgi:hypothetical protein
VGGWQGWREGRSPHLRHGGGLVLAREGVPMHAWP